MDSCLSKLYIHDCTHYYINNKVSFIEHWENNNNNKVKN